MCNFKSGIAMRSGDLLISPKTNRHEELIAEYKLRDDTLGFRDWARVEFNPPRPISDDWKKWCLVLDETNKPEWWEDVEEAVRRKFIAYLKPVLACIPAAMEIAADARKIPWFKPTACDEGLIAGIAAEYLRRLDEWGDVGAMPIRVERSRSAAAAAAAAADAAAADAADAADDAATESDTADSDTADSAAAESAAAESAAADADDSDAAAADALRLIWRVSWYLRPRYAIWRAVRFAVAFPDRDNPWLPLLELWALGTFPVGICKGADGGLEFVVYCPLL